MPHVTLPSPGFQAIILCGPGASLDTFTSDPSEYPKAVLPIANRPMIWYPLDWCYRSGITDIILISPTESKKAIEATLSQNPHLTSLPSPRPTLIAPEHLTITSGTGEVFKQPEVREAIRGDFIVLPCDLVTELAGISLLQEWMVMQAGFGGATGGKDLDTGVAKPFLSNGEKMGRRGGLGVWYETKTENEIKGEETDFIATISCPAPVVPTSKLSLRNDISQLVYSLPTDALNDKIEAAKGLRVRHSLLTKFGSVNMRTTLRDAHVYIFPFWALEFMQNDHFESVSEDVLGWWARATWQDGLVPKLHLDKILGGTSSSGTQADLTLSSHQLQDINVADYSSTTTSATEASTIQLASRTHTAMQAPKSISIPPFLAYKHPEKSPLLIKRVDTTAALLHVSVELAKLQDSTSSDSPSPLSHSAKIAHPDIIPGQSRVEPATCLVADNTTFGSFCNIKESVIGAGCTIGEGVRLVKCVIMDNTTIGNNVTLSGCVVGSRCHIKGGERKDADKTDLRDCEVQSGFVMAWGTNAKAEKFAFSGLDEENHGVDDGETLERGDD